MIWLRGGNAIADEGAKLGAALHPGDDDCIALVIATSGVVSELARYGGRVAEARWTKHRTSLTEARDNRANAEGAPVQAAGKALKPIVTMHRACLDSGMRWRCSECLVTANTVRALRFCCTLMGYTVP